MRKHQKNDTLGKPEKDIPVKPDNDPDPTEHNGDDPEKNDPTRIDEPDKSDPTRIDDPPPTKPPPAKKMKNIWKK